MLAIWAEGDQTTCMKRIRLTPEEKTDLELRHASSRDKKESDRIKAVLLRSEGWTVPMIAQALRLHETTVTRHLNDYRAGKLTLASGGSSERLTEDQTEKLVCHLEEHTYSSTHEIIAYVTKLFGVVYSVPGMNKWLHRHGFSYKKPKGTPHKACKDAQQGFIAKYNALKENLAKDESILFMDSCHPSMATKTAYGWIKTGQSKAIETSASRTRVNIVGAINCLDITKPVVCTYSTVDGESIIDFLEQVRKFSSVPGKINLILDQAGYHKHALVMSKAEELNIELHFLPPYSPNLNPIERLWKVMNEYARNNRFFNTATEFRQSIIDFFSKTVPKIGHVLRSRITDNFQKLNHAV